MTDKRRARSALRFPLSLSPFVVVVAAIAVSALAGFTSAAAVVNAPAAVSIAARGCSTIELTGIDKKFNYQASLLSVESSPFCSRSMVNITKLYVRNACLSLRDNNLGLQSYKELTCDAAKDTGSATCAAAFAQAPRDAVLSAQQILTTGVAQTDVNSSGGKIFDSGDVCGNSDVAYIYVLNMCEFPVRVSIDVRATPNYKGRMPCVKVLGKQLGGVAIIVSLLAAVVGLGLLAGLCCCCVRCCCR